MLKKYISVKRNLILILLITLLSSVILVSCSDDTVINKNAPVITIKQDIVNGALGEVNIYDNIQSITDNEDNIANIIVTFEVSISGESVAVSNGTFFAENVGEYNIKITAKDTSSNTTNKTFKYLVEADSTDPVIVINNAEEIVNIGSSVNIKNYFTVSDNFTPVNEIALIYAVVYNTNEVSTTNGVFTASQNGNYIATITATDSFGNSVQSTVTFISKDALAPELVLNSNYGEIETGAETDLSEYIQQVSDNISSAENITISYTAVFYNAELTGESAPTAQGLFTPSEVGYYNIYITATDEAGNEAFQSVSLLSYPDDFDSKIKGTDSKQIALTGISNGEKTFISFEVLFVIKSNDNIATLKAPDGTILFGSGSIYNNALDKQWTGGGFAVTALGGQTSISFEAGQDSHVFFKNIEYAVVNGVITKDIDSIYGGHIVLPVDSNLQTGDSVGVSLDVFVVLDNYSLNGYAKIIAGVDMAILAANDLSQAPDVVQGKWVTYTFVTQVTNEQLSFNNRIISASLKGIPIMLYTLAQGSPMAGFAAIKNVNISISNVIDTLTVYGSTGTGGKAKPAVLQLGDDFSDGDDVIVTMKVKFNLSTPASSISRIYLPGNVVLMGSSAQVLPDIAAIDNSLTSDWFTITFVTKVKNGTDTFFRSNYPCTAGVTGVHFLFYEAGSASNFMSLQLIEIEKVLAVPGSISTSIAFPKVITESEIESGTLVNVTFKIKTMLHYSLGGLARLYVNTAIGAGNGSEYDLIELDEWTEITLEAYYTGQLEFRTGYTGLNETGIHLLFFDAGNTYNYICIKDISISIN